MASYKYIDAHIKLLMSNEKRIMDVSLYDIRLRLVGWVSPIADFVDGSEKEDAFALAATNLSLSAVTGFIIHTTFWSLYFLNSSAKMGYSPGML